MRERSFQEIIGRFMKWDARDHPTADQQFEVEEELIRLRGMAAQKDLVGNYIKSRRDKIMREIANAADDPQVNDSILRALAGRLRETLRWEQDILRAEQQQKTISTWFTEWIKRGKSPR